MMRAEPRIEKLNGVKAAGVFYNVNLNTDSAGAKTAIGKRPAVDNSENAASALSVYAADGGTLTATNVHVASGVNLNDVYNRSKAQAAVLGSIAANKLGDYVRQFSTANTVRYRPDHRRCSNHQHHSSFCPGAQGRNWTTVSTRS
jgi:hypothetical protein